MHMYNIYIYIYIHTQYLAAPRGGVAEGGHGGGPNARARVVRALS